MHVYVGSYTSVPPENEEGIHLFDFDPGTGVLTAKGLVARVLDPTWIGKNADASVIYGALEGAAGEVGAFRRDASTGALTEINRKSSYGSSPCHLSLTADGSRLLVANYTSGTIATYPVAADGSLEEASDVVQQHGSSINPDRQESAHAHMILQAPDEGRVIVTDLGKDAVIAYVLDPATGKFGRDDARRTENAVTPGTGPRHFAFSPEGDTLYVINELGSSLSVFAYDGQTGTATHKQTSSSLPEGFTGSTTCSEVELSADGRFVYGSNRGHDSIAIWSIDQATGEVTPIGHAKTGRNPRNFAIDPSDNWILVGNLSDNSISVFARDAATGGLTQVGDAVPVPAPAVILYA
jgi:6-phosphogluconolactonase